MKIKYFKLSHTDALGGRVVRLLAKTHTRACSRTINLFTCDDERERFEHVYCRFPALNYYLIFNVVEETSWPYLLVTNSSSRKEKVFNGPNIGESFVCLGNFPALYTTRHERPKNISLEKIVKDTISYFWESNFARTVYGDEPSEIFTSSYEFNLTKKLRFMFGHSELVKYDLSPVSQYRILKELSQYGKLI